MIYLDNSATTYVYDEVLEVMRDIYKNSNFNPSSAYNVASIPDKLLKNARSVIARSINAKDSEIFFNSGGSEGNSTAICGIAYANMNKGRHIISSSVEHDSVYNAVKYLQDNMGFEVTYLKPNKCGVITTDELEKNIRKDTVLVSLMTVNNELGSINDIRALAELTKSINKLTYFHTDAVQSYMKTDIDVSKMQVDILTASAHKLNAPKGVGFIYIKNNTKIHPHIFGGGQESGFRSGTENVAGVCGFAKSVEIQKTKNLDELRKLRDYLKTQIIDKISSIQINTAENSAPHILSVSFAGVRSEVLLHYLETDKIYVSTGSACSSKKKGSRVLANIGLDKKFEDGTIRFSLCHENTRDEINTVVEKLCKYVQDIRKVTKFRG